MAIFVNAPVIVGRGSNTGGPAFPSVSQIVKVVVSADTTLVADCDAYSIIINDSADADTDLAIPIFICPSGTIIEDVGVENFQVWTESANLQIGDTADDDGWIDTVVLVATDTSGLGVIRWAWESVPFRMFLSVSTADGSDVALTSTTITPAYIAQGPRAVYADTAYSTVAIGLGSDDEPRLGLDYQMAIVNAGAVAVTGGLAIYIKYNLAGLQIREPSSNLGTTGD